MTRWMNFKLQVVTLLFLSGADQQAAGLSLPSICKGLLLKEGFYDSVD